MDPQSREIPHAAEQLRSCATTSEPERQSLSAATAEPVCLEAVCTTRGAMAMRSLRSAVREEPLLSLEAGVEQ